MKDVCEALVRLDEEIFTGPETWVQGKSQVGDAMCLVAGVQMVCLGHVISLGGELIPATSPYYAVMSKLLSTMIAKGYGRGSLIQFNDRESTTFADVKEVVAEARRRACED